MTPSKPLQLFLSISGLIAIAIGSIILLAPHALFSSNGVDLGSDPNLLNEIRPPGGALIVMGTLAIGGALVPRLTFTGLLVTTSMYLAYGGSRLLSIAIDGSPSATLWSAMIGELVVGGLGAAALLKLWRRRSLLSSTTAV